jgi:glycosyltransferase involved in cell wall biosynthesis
MNAEIDEILTMHPLISVVVCTFNRSNLLEQCLRSLVDQTLEKNRYEVIIVDNNSSDTTSELAQVFLTQPINAKYVLETQQGLSFARNTGWKCAIGDYIAYIDDDAIAAPDWLAVMAQFITQHSQIQVFGGPYDAYTLTELPHWFPPEYGVHSLGNCDRPIQLGEEWLHGSNMVFRKDIFEKFGGFDETLGMKGKQVAYMEEVDFLLRLEKRGVAIYYVHNMTMRHLIADYKMSLKWLLTAMYKGGKSAKRTFMQDRNFSSHIAALLKHMAYLPLKLIQPQALPFRRRLYYALQWVMWELGAFVESIR